MSLTAQTLAATTSLTTPVQTGDLLVTERAGVAASISVGSLFANLPNLLPLNNPAISGGTINNAVIGGSTPAAGTFTTITGVTATISGNASVTGNITVGGTVDGRDISADGTKLDGIEAGADVTDTANVTAAGALMDSELANGTAVKALNQGVHTTANPTWASASTAGNFTVGGNLTVTGTNNATTLQGNAASAFATAANGFTTFTAATSPGLAGLLTGTAEGKLFNGPVNQQVVVGIRGNDGNDGFHVADTNGTGDTGYGRLVFTVCGNRIEYLGNAVVHTGLSYDDVGSMTYAQNVSGGVINADATVAASSIQYGTTTYTGNWKAMANVNNGAFNIFRKVS